MFTILEIVAQLFTRRNRKTVVLLLPNYLMSVNPAVTEFIVGDKFWGLKCKYYFACKRVFVIVLTQERKLNPYLQSSLFHTYMNTTKRFVVVI